MNLKKKTVPGRSGRLPSGLRAFLDGYIVPPPAADARERAVTGALAEMDRQTRGAAWSLLRQVRVELRFLPLWYYGASLLLVAFGAWLLLTEHETAVQLGLLAGMTPLPLLLGLVELFHGSDTGMAEIEAVCRYSQARVMSARMLIIGGLSVVLAAALGLCARCPSPALTAALVVIPFCLSAAGGLCLSAWMQGKADSGQTALIIAAVNGSAAGIVSMYPRRILAFPEGGWLILMAFSAALLALTLYYTLRRAGRSYERMICPWN